MTKKENKDNLLVEEKIEHAFKALHHEIDFASKTLNVKSGDLQIFCMASSCHLNSR